MPAVDALRHTDQPLSVVIQQPEPADSEHVLLQCDGRRDVLVPIQLTDVADGCAATLHWGRVLLRELQHSRDDVFIAVCDVCRQQLLCRVQRCADVDWRACADVYWRLPADHQQ